MLFQIPEADAGNQHRKQQEDGRADEKGQEGEPEGGEAACHHGAHSDSDGKGAEQVGGRQGDDGIAETFIYQHPAELLFRHADGLDDGEFPSAGNDGRDHGVDEVEDADQGDDDADGAARNGGGAGFRLVLAGHALPGDHGQAGVHRFRVGIQKCLCFLQMRVVHVEKQLS